MCGEAGVADVRTRQCGPVSSRVPGGIWTCLLFGARCLPAGQATSRRVGTGGGGQPFSGGSRSGRHTAFPVPLICPAAVGPQAAVTPPGWDPGPTPLAHDLKEEPNLPEPTQVTPGLLVPSLPASAGAWVHVISHKEAPPLGWQGGGEAASGVVLGAAMGPHFPSELPWGSPSGAVSPQPGRGLWRPAEGLSGQASSRGQLLVARQRLCRQGCVFSRQCVRASDVLPACGVLPRRLPCHVLPGRLAELPVQVTRGGAAAGSRVALPAWWPGASRCSPSRRCVVRIPVR